MKFRRPFHGVRMGEIYPVTFEKGEECPPELEAAAIELGAVRRPKGAIIESEEEDDEGEGEGGGEELSDGAALGDAGGEV